MERRVQSLVDVLSSVYHFLQKQKDAAAKEKVARALANAGAKKARAAKSAPRSPKARALAKERAQASSEKKARGALRVDLSARAVAEGGKASLAVSRADSTIYPGSTSDNASSANSNETASAGALPPPLSVPEPLSPPGLRESVSPNRNKKIDGFSAHTDGRLDSGGGDGCGGSSSASSGVGSVSGPLSGTGTGSGSGSGSGSGFAVLESESGASTAVAMVVSDVDSDGDGEAKKGRGRKGAREVGRDKEGHCAAATADGSSAMVKREETKAAGGGGDTGRIRSDGKDRNEDHSDAGEDDELDLASLSVRPPLKLLEDAAVVEALWSGKQSMMRRLVRRLEAVYHEKCIVAEVADSSSGEEEDAKEEEAEGDSSGGESSAKVCTVTWLA